jgi:mRNA-degrading endonuclease YafQ of YafQ-DinJ toxin-antitoxin module
MTEIIEKVVKAGELPPGLRDDPFDPALENHALSGRMTGKRALAAADDLRIVFTERGHYQDVTLPDVGSHSGMYRR